MKGFIELSVIGGKNDGASLLVNVADIITVCDGDKSTFITLRSEYYKKGNVTWEVDENVDEIKHKIIKACGGNVS